jgi:hypothetical protein
MTPLTNHDSRERARLDASFLEICPLPSAAVVESWFATDAGGPDRPLDVLLTLYRDGGLSPEHRRRVEERLSTDPKFRARLEHIDRTCNAEEVDGGDPPNAEDRGENLWDLMELLYGQGVELPFAGRVHRRDGMPPRYAWWQSRAMPPDAGDFVRQLVDDLGLRSGVELVDYAFRVVAATGEADHWISEVGCARDRGTIDSALACYLIWQFAESAIRRLSDTHPVLSKLSARIERIEREYDADELVTWANHAGPPGWESLCEEWDATHDELLILLLKRHEEYEVLHASLREEQTLWEGRRQIYGS